MGKKVGVTIVIVVVMVVGYFQIKNSNNKNEHLRFTNQTQNTNTQKEPELKLSEWSIPKLRERKYQSDIVTERRVKANSEVVSFVSDGLKQYALMLTPSGKQPAGGWPVIILNHGHIEPSVYSTETSYRTYSNYLAGKGFVVIKPDYRGHGKSEGEAESLLARIGYAIDVLNLLAGVEKLPNIDKTRVYMWGHSMGGEVTLRVLEVTDKVKVASLWAPAVTNFPENTLYFARRDPTRAARRMAEYEEHFGGDLGLRVATLADENLKLVKIPVVVQHATADESVPYSWGEEVSKRLSENGVAVAFQGITGWH